MCIGCRGAKDKRIASKCVYLYTELQELKLRSEHLYKYFKKEEFKDKMITLSLFIDNLSTKCPDVEELNKIRKRIDEYTEFVNNRQR